MILKIFTQPNCPKCPPAKKLGKELKKRLNTPGVAPQLRGSELGVEYWDTLTVDGMAEGAFYQVMATPTVLLCDDSGKAVEGWRGKTPSKKEIFSKIKI